MSRGGFSLGKIFEEIFYKYFHNDKIIISLEEKDDGWWYGNY
ncbi:hypothetical protein [Escherichia coli]